jgi:uncharacterized protein YifN (PemK superfamily)
MPLNYYPRAGNIYIADFKGFEPPEMVKVRPIVVISPRLPHRSEIVTIVPLSTTAPKHDLPFCVKLSKNYMPNEPIDKEVWAKCDMIMNVSKNRLDAIKIGRRKYVYPTLSHEDLILIRRGVLHGLGF